MKHIYLFLLLIFTSVSVHAQWELIVPFNPNPACYFVFQDVYFLNKDTGFVVGDSSYHDGGIILRTYDGGQNWDTTFTKGVIYSVQFINESFGFAGSSFGRFYKTIDGGDNWIEIPMPPPFHQVLGQSIYFKNANEGFLCARYGGWMCDPILCHTTDGGVNWQSVSPSGGCLDFTSPNIGYAGILHKTLNAGASWNLWLDSIATQLPVNFRNAKTIDFINDTTGVAAGMYMAGSPYNNNRGMVGVTHDGGFNYCLHQINNWYSVMDIVMWDLKNIYAVGRLCPQDTNNPQFLSVFIASKDGGNTWAYQEHEIDSAYGYPIMHALCFPTREVGYAVSYFGQVYKTTNAGGNLIPMLNSEGIEPNSTGAGELLFPNPVSDELSLKCCNLNIDGLVLKVCSVNGRLVQQSGMYWYDGEYLKIDVSHLPQGIYLIETVNNKKTSVQKFIKK